MAGVLPWNFSSMKISAPSGSDVMVTVPKPSGEDVLFCESGAGADSLTKELVPGDCVESAESAAVAGPLPRPEVCEPGLELG